MKYRACEEDYAWNTSICAGKCEKNCDIGEYLKDFTCRKSLVDNLGVTCEDIVVTSETALINFIDKRNYWLLCVALLAITCLILVIRVGSIFQI